MSPGKATAQASDVQVVHTCIGTITPKPSALSVSGKTFNSTPSRAEVVLPSHAWEDIPCSLRRGLIVPCRLLRPWSWECRGSSSWLPDCVRKRTLLSFLWSKTHPLSARDSAVWERCVMCRQSSYRQTQEEAGRKFARADCNETWLELTKVEAHAQHDGLLRGPRLPSSLPHAGSTRCSFKSVCCLPLACHHSCLLMATEGNVEITLADLAGRCFVSRILKLQLFRCCLSGCRCWIPSFRSRWRSHAENRGFATAVKVCSGLFFTIARASISEFVPFFTCNTGQGNPFMPTHPRPQAR